LKLQAQREFAYSQMVIKPLFLRSAGERGATEIEIKRQRQRENSPRDTGSKYSPPKKQKKQKKKHYLISFLQLAAQLIWNKKGMYLEITMCLNLVC